MRLDTLWIVTFAKNQSTLGDIRFETTPRGFALQVRGGLDPDEIAAVFDSEPEATHLALQLLHLRDKARAVIGGSGA